MQAVKFASGCSWKDLSNNGLVAKRELHVQKRAVDSSVDSTADASKLAIAVFGSADLFLAVSARTSGVRTHALSLD